MAYILVLSQKFFKANLDVLKIVILSKNKLEVCVKLFATVVLDSNLILIIRNVESGKFRHTFAMLPIRIYPNLLYKFTLHLFLRIICGKIEIKSCLLQCTALFLRFIRLK